MFGLSDRDLKAKLGHLPIIGLCGAIASGKSYVANVFAKHGCAVFDADAEAHRILDKHAEDVRNHWKSGDDLIRGDGTVDRSKLSALIFDAHRPEWSMDWLEGLMFPDLYEARDKFIEMHNDKMPIVLDCPLLFEKGWNDLCDYIIFIHAPRNVLLERARQRGWDEEHYKNMESLQWSVEKKEKMADMIICTVPPHSDEITDIVASTILEISRSKK